MSPFKQAILAKELYRRRLEDVTREHPGRPVHPSRVDIEIGVRMRLMGYDRNEIVQTIKEAASRDRPGETRDWDAYAKSTVTVVFGVQGDRAAERLRRRDERWRPLEGRQPDEPEPPPPGRPFSRSGPER